ncbi:hypothetical protein G7009_02410 [Pseudomonas capeferrum]|uniref:hypothetical protein n=1 Tax=Pseudomonas capeferrum TaxID=1495066 RepID=UPI0015E42B83|nr:hypothetical protein [Pseudomonas capeferrum]MBA1200648.1 hypothetical protein [Pseudomonas capeferrum]
MYKLLARVWAFSGDIILDADQPGPNEIDSQVLIEQNSATTIHLSIDVCYHHAIPSGNTSSLA